MPPYPNPPDSVSPDDVPEPEYMPGGVPIPAFTTWQPKRQRSGGRPRRSALLSMT